MNETNNQRAYRLTNIDLVRGLAIVLMAIDHVRDFFLKDNLQDPMGDPNVDPALYLTRWITHFCAPVFVLLAGTSAGLMTARKTRFELGQFLFKRGLWLLFVEVVVISTATSFAPFGLEQIGGKTLVILQVIYAIGVGMMVLAAAQFMGRRWCLVAGLLIFFGHNLLDVYWPVTGVLETQWPLWVALHSQMAVTLGPFMIVFAYPILSWVGVMLLGFGLASVFELPAEAQKTALRRIGGAMIALFFVLRFFDGYGDTNQWQTQAGGALYTAMDFFNTSKYGPSLQFLLMTLGPALVLTAYADDLRGGIKDALVMFGRVPFAFYVVHWFLIHTASVVLGVAQGFKLNELMTHFVFYPKGYGVNLLLVYAIWIGVILLLYPFCRWVAEVKARRRDWWLSYV
jgi:uncharacterized membrane protein